VVAADETILISAANHGAEHRGALEEIDLLDPGEGHRDGQPTVGRL
jgi:hypothetical protein